MKNILYIGVTVVVVLLIIVFFSTRSKNSDNQANNVPANTTQTETVNPNDKNMPVTAAELAKLKAGIETSLQADNLAGLSNK